MLDIHEIAGHLGVNVRYVRRLVAERRIPYVKWGNLFRFDPEQISNWLAEQRVDPVVTRDVIDDPADGSHMTRCVIGRRLKTHRRME